MVACQSFKASTVAATSCYTDDPGAPLRHHNGRNTGGEPFADHPARHGSKHGFSRQAHQHRQPQLLQHLQLTQQRQVVLQGLPKPNPGSTSSRVRSIPAATQESTRPAK